MQQPRWPVARRHRPISRGQRRWCAKRRGAQIFLLQELFASRYFCQDEYPGDLNRALLAQGYPTLARFEALAAELQVVLPVSFFELAGQARFNCVAVIDADERRLGLYRKTHIPHGADYQEKYHFSPGDTRFRVWDTAFGKIGAGICWDQWFPEAARAMALSGAEPRLRLSEIGADDWDSAPHWQRVQQGYAGAEPGAANRLRAELGRFGTEMTFYGSSFIADETNWRPRSPKPIR